jgi:hypothetical protein
MEFVQKLFARIHGRAMPLPIRLQSRNPYAGDAPCVPLGYESRRPPLFGLPISKPADIDPSLLAAIQAVTGKRPRRVLDHLLAHGVVTTEDLEKMGYKHAPRAARDVRELGIPLVTTRTVSADGKSIAAYTLGDPEEIDGSKLGGRSVLPKELRDRLHGLQGGRCAVCSYRYAARYLQVDHRVPYEVAGESATPSETTRFMALCGSCQRKKSWSCEHCGNWTTRDAMTCAACFWADPVGYTHVAREDIRTLTLTFAGQDALTFDQLRARLPADRLADAARSAILGLVSSRG